jgi:hypothetical protein
MSKQTPIHDVPKVVEGQMLVSRDQARVILGGISYITVIRLEEAQRLRAIRLTPNRKAKAFYRLADVEALAESYYVDPLKQLDNAAANSESAQQTDEA